MCVHTYFFNQLLIMFLMHNCSENLSWSKGPVNISLRGLHHQGDDYCKFRRNSQVYGMAMPCKGEVTLSVLATSIFDRDEAIAALLGGDYMPGSLADALANQDIRVRSVPLSSSRYRLTRTAAMSSTGSLTTYLRSPSTTSKANSRYDDSTLSPLVDEIDSKDSENPLGNLQWLTSKRLIGSMELLEELCALDKVLLFHLFLASHEVSTERLRTVIGKKVKEKDKRNQAIDPTRDNAKLTPSILTMIFDDIAINLPNPDMRRITPLKCLYVINNQSSKKHNNSTASTDFGTLVVELFQKDEVFISLKISKLTKGCGQLSALLKIVVKSFFLTLKMCGLRAVKVKNDLSLSSISRTVSTFQRKIIESCISSARSMLLLNSKRDSNLLLLMSELVQTKTALGFQLLEGNMKPLLQRGSNSVIKHDLSLNLDVYSDLNGRALVTHLCAVSSTSPSGIEMESLLQCKSQKANYDFCNRNYHKNFIIVFDNYLTLIYSFIAFPLGLSIYHISNVFSQSHLYHLYSISSICICMKLNIICISCEV